MSKTTCKSRVAIIGGGFAGLACANNLDSRRFAVTLIDRKRHFEFLPNIHELLSGVKKPEALRLSLGPAMSQVGHDFVCGNVDAVDPERCAVSVGGKRIEADHLVIANGSADADFGVPGVHTHALPFKSVEQCSSIHKRLAALTKTRTPARVVIVGGGLEGVEGLGEILRGYRDTALKIQLLEAQRQILPSMTDAVAQLIEKTASDCGAELITGDPVAKITAKTVFLQSGRRLRSDATIWTGGPTPPALFYHAGLADEGRWIPVDPTLRHTRFPRVFVAGDAAALETPVAKQAYHALDMGRCVADNITREANRRRIRRFKASPKPTLLSFGDLTTVLISGKQALAGPVLAAGKEAVFSAVMTQLDQRAPSDRIGALLARNKSAGKELLLPTLTDLKRLRRHGSVKIIRG